MFSNKEVKEKLNTLLELIGGHAFEGLMSNYYVDMWLVEKEINDMINAIPDITNIKTYENKCHDCKNSKVQWCAEPCVECEGYSKYERK